MPIVDNIRPTDIDQFTIVLSALIKLNRIDLAENLVTQFLQTSEDEGAV